MNVYDVERLAVQRTATLRKEAAVMAVIRARRAPNLAHIAAGALRRLAARLDDERTVPVAFDIAQPIVTVARRAA